MIILVIIKVILLPHLLLTEPGRNYRVLRN